MEENHDMKTPSANLAARVAVLGILSLFLIYYVFGFDSTFIIATSLTLGVSLMVVLTWITATIRAVLRGSREGADLLALGIWLLALGFLISRIFAGIYLIKGRPEWIRDTIFNPLGPWTCLWGLGIVLLAPGTTQGEIPNMNLVYILIAVAIGSAAASASLTYFLVAGTP